MQNQRYDYIDVAKETASGRSKGQTTRIFTTGDDLDETFWLKYLGEEFRHAVHLQVDDDNNVVPIEHKNKPQVFQNNLNNIENKEEKRTRFVRQPSDDNKQIPVESLYKLDDNQYPTEKPEIFNMNPTTSLHDTKQKHLNTSNKNTKKPLKPKKKVLIHNKYKQKIIKVKPSSPLKAIHEPIVVNLPQTEEAEHQINEEQVPVVVQMPPVIYHQKADLYPGQIPNSALSNQNGNIYDIGNQKGNLYYGKITNLPLNNQHHHTHSYTTHTHTFSHSNLPESPQQQEHNHPSDYTLHHQIQQPYSYQTQPLSTMSLNQLPVASPPSR